MTAVALFGEVSPASTTPKPTSQQPFQRIPGTRRAYVTLEDGVRLERRTVYLTAPAWKAVWRLCNASRISTSKLFESMVIEADKQATRSKEDAHV